MRPSLDGRILPSVSQRVLLDIATAERIPIRVAPLPLNDLAAADAVLLTSSIRLMHLAQPAWGAARKPSAKAAAVVAALASGLAQRTVPRRGAR